MRKLFKLLKQAWKDIVTERHYWDKWERKQ
jgi:hypothetical protein